MKAKLTRVCLAQISRSGEVEVAFDGFVRPCLLDGLALPHFVTPTISLDIGSSRICESCPILYQVTALQVGSVNISHCQNPNRVRVLCTQSKVYYQLETSDSSYCYILTALLAKSQICMLAFYIAQSSGCYSLKTAG